MNLHKLNQKLNKIDPSLNASFHHGAICLTGEVDNYEKVLAAGRIALKINAIGVVNDVKVTGKEISMKIPSMIDKTLDQREVDVLIIGGGVSGAAILRELSKYQLKTLMVEKGSDLAVGQSSRNGGVVHVGLNFSKHTLKLKYCVSGNRMFPKLCEDLHVPFENRGQVTFARTKLEMLALYFAAKGGRKKNIPQLKLMSREELLKIEPSIPSWSCGGLFMGTGGITCPHRLTFALGENAIENGAEIALNTAVLDMTLEDDMIVEVVTNRGVIRPKVVINAAGVFADKIAEMAKDRTFTIHPRAGTYLITDKKVGHLVNSSIGKTPFTLSPSHLKSLPKTPLAFIKATLKNMHSHSKGVGLIHSVDGNMLVGPNALELFEREDYATDRDIVDTIIKVQQEVQPNLHPQDVIAYFTGIRAATYEEDFVIRQGIKTKNIFEVAGIQSPGLTAAPAIAVDISHWVVRFLREGGVMVKENEHFNPKRIEKPILKELTVSERNRRIKENQNYGEIICRCEEISKGEIIDVLRSPLPVFTIDGIKKRLRPGMGRCQGGFCLPLVMKIIAEETGIAMKDIVNHVSESHFIFRNTK